ncbi:MAG: hypothetical protein AAF039_00100 [Bacteroidota bacterium]
MSSSRADRLQIIGTIMALVISIIAMVTSIYEAGIMKSQQKSMVWPYLSVSQQYNSEGFGIKITNKGTGPAIVTSVQLDYKGMPMENVDVLMDSLNPDRTFGYDILRNSTIGNHVFTSGEEMMLFGLPYNDETRVVVENIPKIRMRVGYKSVLDEYWYYDSEDDRHYKEEFKAITEFKN